MMLLSSRYELGGMRLDRAVTPLPLSNESLNQGAFSLGLVSTSAWSGEAACPLIHPARGCSLPPGPIGFVTWPSVVL